MKQTSTVVLVVACVVGLASVVAAAPPKPNAAANDSDAAAVIAAEQKVLEAVTRGDAAGFNAAAGDAIVMVGPQGTFTWKASDTAALLGRCVTRSLQPSQLKATRVSDDVVVLTYDADSDQVCDGKRGPQMVHGLSVWRRSGQRWSVVAHSEVPAESSAVAKPAAAASADALTAETRAEVEAAVRKSVDRLFAAARETNGDALLSLTSTPGGVCLFKDRIAPCAEVWAGYRRAWSDANPDRGVRQEFSGETVQVLALSPTVAITALTIPEGRYYTKAGLTDRSRFSMMLVYVLEGGEWRIHSAQQAAWPVAP